MFRKMPFILLLGALTLQASDWSMQEITFNMDKKQLTEKGFKCEKDSCKKEFKNAKNQSILNDLTVLLDHESKPYKIIGKFEKFHGVEDIAFMNALKQKYKSENDVDVKIDYWYYNGTAIYSMVWATLKQRETAYFNFLEKDYLSKLK